MGRELACVEFSDRKYVEINRSYVGAEELLQFVDVLLDAKYKK